MRVLVHILYQTFNKNFNLVYFTKDKIGPLDRLFSFEKANFENFTVDDLEFFVPDWNMREHAQNALFHA